MTPWDRLQQFDHDQLKRELREQDRKRWIHPERDPELAKIWVIYVWRDATWLLAGFSRAPRSVNAKVIRKIRRKLGVSVRLKETIDIRDLDHARRCGPPVEPPTRHQSTRPDEVLAVALRKPTPAELALIDRRQAILERRRTHAYLELRRSPGAVVVD